MHTGHAHSRQKRLWQRGLIALAVFAFVELLGSVICAHIIDGYSGINLIQTSSNFIDSMDTPDANTPAARAGFKKGDRVDVRDLSPNDRVEWRNYLIEGRSYDIPIRRGNARTTLHIVVDRNVADLPGWQQIRWNFYVRFVAEALLICVAGFLAARRADSADVRILSLAILTFIVGDDFSLGSAWSTGSSLVDTIAWTIGPFISYAGLALLGTYALRFARPASRFRRWFTWATYAIVPVVSIALGIETVGFYLGRIDGYAGLYADPRFLGVIEVAPYLAPLLCASVAIWAARGAERNRILWATASLAMLYVGPIASNLLSLANIASQSVFWDVHNVPYFIAAVGLLYSLGGRRLLDTGFVLNRAAVFTGVSLVVVGTFILVEWALGGWLASASKNTNVAVSAALALGLGLSIYPIHARVDRFIDSVFFRKRHEADRALRAFADEAVFITDPALVVTRAEHVLTRTTECTWAHFAIYDGVSSFGGVDENDPALVSMRATHQMQHLNDSESRLRGELAFPMLARGRLVGALVLGPKRLGETYAPDERTAIAVLARGVGVALDVLGARTEPTAENVLETVLESNRAILAAIERLTDAVGTRVRETGAADAGR